MSCFDRRVAVEIEAVDFALVANFAELVEWCFDGIDALAADFDDVAEGGDAELGEQLFGERAGGDADGRFAGTGAFEDAADRAEEFHRAGKVAVAGARAREVVEALEFVVAVGDFEHDRAAEGDAAPDAGEDVDGVGFDPLPAAAAVAALAALELDVDRLDVDGDAGGEAVDQGDQCFAVRFAGGEVAEHGGRRIRIGDAGCGGGPSCRPFILVGGWGCRKLSWRVADRAVFFARRQVVWTKCAFSRKATSYFQGDKLFHVALSLSFFDRITGSVRIDGMDGKRFATEFTESTEENGGNEWRGQEIERVR